MASNPQHEAEYIRQLFLGITLALVDNKDGLTVEIEEEETCSIIRIRVKEPELGKIVGKGGRTARSLRTILNAMSMKLGRRLNLDIISA